jgi:lipopolysaccharide/colanic/teichoic acid biosynthesis glycosyltransferase
MTRQGLPRFVELVLALAALALLLPILLVIAAAVFVDSSGPVLYRQERVGRHGRLFVLRKFRTMRVNGGGPLLTAAGDPRVTGVGRWLRRLKLDELPQLWNVVRGDMGLVGPRPEVGAYVDPSNPDWQQVLSARPGLTDPITMRLRNEEALLACVDDDRDRFYRSHLQPYKLRGYRAYLLSRTWKSDLRVLWQTAAAVLVPSSMPRPPIEEIEPDVQIHSDVHR